MKVRQPAHFLHKVQKHYRAGVRTAFAAFAPDIAKYMEQEMNK